MGATLHAFDFLDKPPAPAPVEIVFGDEPFLKTLVLNCLRKCVLPGDDIPFAEFDGSTTQWRDVMDEIRTVSLFNTAGTRLAIVRNGDDFVAKHRLQLEDYVKKPEKNGTLVLEVSRWPANTRLFKLVGEFGVQVECRAPQIVRGKQKTIDTGRIIDWLLEWGKSRHELAMTKKAAALLLELVGPEFGILDQETAKLALFTSAKGTVDDRLVGDVVGGWRAKTAWELIDAAVSGNSGDALRQLDRLLQSGEPPAALFGSISWSLRRFAAATRAYERAERGGRRITLTDALTLGGFNKWRKTDLVNGEKHLKRLGRKRAAQLFQGLLDTDLALKGTHSSPEMARFALEHLLLRMDRELKGSA